MNDEVPRFEVVMQNSIINEKLYTIMQITVFKAIFGAKN